MHALACIVYFISRTFSSCGRLTTVRLVVFMRLQLFTLHNLHKLNLLKGRFTRLRKRYPIWFRSLFWTNVVVFPLLFGLIFGINDARVQWQYYKDDLDFYHTSWLPASLSVFILSLKQRSHSFFQGDSNITCCIHISLETYLSRPVPMPSMEMSTLFRRSDPCMPIF